MKTTIGELKQLIKEAVSKKKRIKLDQNQLHALKGSLVQGMDWDEHPEWRWVYDDVFAKLNNRKTKYPVTIDVPVSQSWNVDIISAIESEVTRDPDDEEESGNDYLIDRDELIDLVTSEDAPDEDEPLRLFHLLNSAGRYTPHNIGLDPAQATQLEQLIAQRKALFAAPNIDYAALKQLTAQIDEIINSLNKRVPRYG